MSESQSEKVLEIVVDFANAVEAAAVNVKRQAAELVGVKEAVAVPEETFNILNFEKQTGNRIGEFEVADKKNNSAVAEKFEAAFNILSKANATISERYHGQGYGHSYWIYQKRIYRQKLKQT